jgi:hypothetical protein
VAALREQGLLSRTQIRDLGGRRVRGEEITRALEPLARQGKIACELRKAGSLGGRPQEVWRFQQDDPQLVRS